MVTIPKRYALLFVVAFVLAAIGAASEISEHNRLCIEAGIAKIPSPGETNREIFPGIPGDVPAGTPGNSR